MQSSIVLLTDPKASLRKMLTTTYAAVKPAYTFRPDVFFPDVQAVASIGFNASPIPSEMNYLELSADNKPDGPSLL